VYVTDYEHNAVHRRQLDDTYEMLHFNPVGALWPDTLSVAADGHLYWTANQLQRLGRFHEGQDQRQRPYYLFRMPVDGTPVLLR
jgi:sugar lactone lactonase YvrE